MGIVIAIVCVATGINLALWGALYARLDGLPLRVWSMLKKERTDGEGAALTLLQERTAAKVGAIVKSLRDYDEHVAAGYRAQVAEAQVRARIAERQSSEAGVALSAASALVRELRGLLDGTSGGTRASLRSPPAVTEGRRTVAAADADDAPATPPSTQAGDDGRRTSSRPPPQVQLAGCEVASRERRASRDGLSSGIAPVPSDAEERLSGDDDLTCVSLRPLPGVLDATLVSPVGGKGRAR
jgi:hypothetical protein